MTDQESRYMRVPSTRRIVGFLHKEVKKLAGNERDFKGVWIPKTVWLDERLNALDKVILTEIDSLDMSERGCYASNKHIADFCQCSETKVSTAISKLVKLGYLYVQKFDGRQRELKSRLSNFERQELKNCESAIKKLKESNTGSNPPNNTEKIKYIVDYLNQQAGKNFRSTSKATQQHINARLAEGFTVENFITVIDTMCAKWKGKEMDEYLRPSTLFGPKFENYLNAKVTTGRNGNNGQNAGDSSKTQYSHIV